MIKKSSSITVLLLGALLIVLGYFGGHAGSKVSVIMGLTFGILLIISSFFMFRGKKIASYFANSLIFILLITFCVRYVATGKFLPAFMAVVSSVALIFLTAQTIRWRK